MKLLKLFLLVASFSLFLGVGNIMSQDNCGAAVTIPVEMYSTCGLMALQNVDLNSATASSGTPNPTCGNYSAASKDQWYKFQVPTGVTEMAFHAFNSNLLGGFGGNSEPAMAIYRGSDCSSLTLLACFASAGGFMTNGEIRWEPLNGLNPGETLYIRTWDKDNTTNQRYFIAASVRLDMPEDDCNSPMELSTGGCNILSTGGDIPAPDLCGWGTTDNSIFFNFTVYADDPQPYVIEVQNGECWNNGGMETPEAQFAVYQWNGVNCTGIGGAGATYMGCGNGTGTVTFSANLPPGQYILAMDGYSTLSGNSLCLFGFSAPFIEPVDIAVNLTTNNASCGELGSASVTILESCTGTPTVNWSTGATGTSVTGLAPGNYSVTVSDGDDCEPVIETFTITDVGNFSVSAFSTGDPCDLSQSGTAEVSGATPGQCTFSWNTLPAQNTQTAQFTESGTYTVTAIYGTCQDSDQVTVSFHDHIIISNFSDNNCINSNTQYEVSFTVNSSGGGPADFYVNDGGGDVLYSGSYTGVFDSGDNYSLTISDLNDCDVFSYNGAHDCGCSTFAGTMLNTTPLTLCADECTDMISHNDDDYLEADDILEFIVHSGEYPGIALARSLTPEFCFSQLNGGEYGVTYYVSAIAGNDLGGYVNNGDPCYSQSPGVPVVWFENPIAFISASELTTCGLEISINASNPQFGMSGSWTASETFYAIGGTSIYTPNVNVLVTDYGTVNFTWSVTNGICTGSDEVVVNFLPTPTAYAGEDFAICGNVANLVATQSIPGSTGQWTGPGSFTNPTQPTTQVTGVYGTQTYTWRESIGICYTLDQININFIQAPNPVVTSQYDTVCGNTGSLEVFGVTGTGSWAAYLDGSPLVPAPIYTPGLSHPATSVTIGNYPTDQYSRTVEFIWTETTSGGAQQCSTSVSTFVTFSREPEASIGASDEAEVCGNEYTFAADITGNEWAQGYWISPQIIASFDNNTMPDATVTISAPGSYGDSASVRAPFIWAMQNTGCTSLDTMWLTFYRRPIANAGLDRSVCGKNYTLGAVYNFPETDNYEPFGTWSVHSRPIPAASANISPQTGDTVNVTVSHVGVWEFLFRENNSNLPSCFSVDTVKITFIETPIISAGEDKDVCGTQTQLEGISGGNNGTWIPNGTYIHDINNPTSLVTSNTYGPINFIWLESNEFCSAKDTVTITFWRKPDANILTDLEDSTVCGLRFERLRAESPGTGISGYWYTQNPASVFDNPFAQFTAVTVPNYGYHDFYWIEETGPEMIPGFCTDTAGPLRIHFIEVPTANAGGDTLFCGKSGYLNAIPTTGTGVWSTPSSLISIENINDPNSYIESEVLNSGNQTNPFFLLIWTEDNTNGCTDKDTMKVIFARIPTANMQIIPPKCFGEIATIKASEDTLRQYTWNFYGGGVTNSETNAAGGTFRNFVQWNNSDDTHIVSLITTNSWGCQSPINIDTIAEPPIPDFDMIIIADTCLIGKGGVIFGDTLDNNSFFWLDTLYGPTPGTPITSVYNIPAGVYDIRTSYQTLNMTHYAYYISTFGNANCVDTIEFEVMPIGLIDANFEISADIILEDLTAPEAPVIFLNYSDYDDVRKRCEWHFGDGNVLKNCDDLVEHTYTEAGCFTPFLIVMNRDLPECRDTAFLDACIRIDNQSSLEIPNVFSPNGDGINDYFQVKATTLRTFSGTIVNRWGRAVYTWENWKDLDAGWDGNLDGGTKAAPGVYYFIIKAEGLDGQPYEEHGALHLYRD